MLTRSPLHGANSLWDGFNMPNTNCGNSLQRSGPSVQETVSLCTASASALLYREIWNLQSLPQSLTRPKMSKLCDSYDEKPVEQHRLHGQQEGHFRSQNLLAKPQSQQRHRRSQGAQGWPGFSSTPACVAGNPP